ncbi:translation elongation factor [Sulfodiicoccus acidiphilus]|nr:translation elongation factor [Sulfodiicoccus acidiphilus]
MIRGYVATILSTNLDLGMEIGRKLGKLHEDEATKIFYRKREDHLLSVLFPTGLPSRLVEAAECLTVSSSFFLRLPDSPKPEDGELLLLSEASGIEGSVIASTQVAGKLLNGTSLAGKISQEVKEVSYETPDRGYIAVDKVFQVRGIGTVVLGFSSTQLGVHDRLLTLPQGKEVEVKSIQVLDEDQDAVGPGVRVGIALKNVRQEELRGLYSMVKPETKVVDSIRGKLVKFEWADYSPGMFHVVSSGSSSVASVEGQGEVEVRLNRRLPFSSRFLLLNLNARPKKPRVVGYLEA